MADESGPLSFKELPDKIRAFVKLYIYVGAPTIVAIILFYFLQVRMTALESKLTEHATQAEKHDQIEQRLADQGEQMIAIMIRTCIGVAKTDDDKILCGIVRKQQ